MRNRRLMDSRRPIKTRSKIRARSQRLKTNSNSNRNRRPKFRHTLKRKPGKLPLPRGVGTVVMETKWALLRDG